MMMNAVKTTTSAWNRKYELTCSANSYRICWMSIDRSMMSNELLSVGMSADAVGSESLDFVIGGRW